MGKGLQHYTAVITTKAPLFVGSGKAIGKKEYIFSPGERLVYIPDMAKMFRSFQKKNLLDDYERYLLRESYDFSFWLKDHKIEKREYLTWTAYSIHSGDAVFEKKGKKEILTFMKDAYGCPYVPGSSLKGAFRTALLTAAILQNPADYRKIKAAVKTDRLGAGRKSLRLEVKQLETQTLNTLDCKMDKPSDAVNDVLRGLRVGDSEPLHTSDLTLCQKIDVGLGGGPPKKLPILRECIRPGTEIRFPLTIDPVLCPYTKEQLLQAIEQQTREYYRCFRRAFFPEQVPLQGELYLGGGCGYATKTITYPLLGEGEVKRVSEIIDATLGKRAKEEHGHRRDAERGASPHTLKCTRYQNKPYEMGVCQITIT